MITSYIPHLRYTSKRWHHKWWHRRLLQDCRGIAALEFALSTPILAILLLGSIEVTRYVLITQKVEKAAISVSDLIAQSGDDLTVNEISSLLAAAGQIMQPMDFNSDGVVIISSITNNDYGYPEISWQHTGGGNLTAYSDIGEQGEVANMPDGFTLSNTENVIVAEIYFDFSPLLPGHLLNNVTLYRTAYYKPRLGELINPPS